MKAAINTIYGPPEVVQIQDVSKPIAKDNEVLIKIHTSTVNRTDCGFRKPEYLIVYAFAGFPKPKNKILGTELSGVIEAVGKNVTKFKVGDQVFGLSTFKFGTHAEYICMSEKSSFALKPNNMTLSEAGAVTEGLMLGLNYIREIDFKKSPKILINGASGSIGSACLQLAKYYGAQHVTAVCNTKNVELIRSLGADHVIDYEKNDFTECGQMFDVVLDAVGKSTFGKCKKILKQGGVYFSSELGPNSENVYLALFTPFFSNKKVKFPIPTDSQKDTELYKEIIESGKYKAVIDRTYPLDDIIEAYKYVETGQKTGNVAIRVSDF
ncbi:MAG: NAD(P)-dependent alcohol dehydrogenase [Bacteroidota bacterium]|nr:NAD(P)-dependent alcohol dehydrogenase [Bacteroidota bacterium]